jgi:TetR/AcrR family transcriptional regulator, cholesterol catabolism regulator
MTILELTRRERKKEETKERIFNAALKLFKTKGFEVTTIDDITEKADVAKGTFFNYFPKKEAVLSYLSEQWLEEAEDNVGAVLATGAPDRERIIGAFVHVARFYEEDRAFSRHVLRSWMERAYDESDPVCHRWHTLGVNVVKELQARGILRSDVDSARAEYLLQSVYAGTVAMWLQTEPAPFALRAELRERLLLVIDGLKGRKD